MTQSGLRRTATNMNRTFGSRLYDRTGSMMRTNSSQFSTTGKIKNTNR